jgi:hypothetical protein
LKSLIALCQSLAAMAFRPAETQPMYSLPHIAGARFELSAIPPEGLAVGGAFGMFEAPQAT